jgi:hypothetical protein
MNWKEDKVLKSQEKHNNQICKEERNSPELNKGRVDTQDYTAFQNDRRQELKRDVNIAISSRRLRKLPITRRDDFLWMDRRQEKPPSNKGRGPCMLDNPLIVFHQNIGGLREKVDELISSISHNLPHILCLSEHHLTSSTETRLV